MTPNPERLSDEELERFEQRIGSEFDDEATLSGDEMRRLLAELRSLRATLSTPMPCGWPAPVPASPAKPTMVLWEALDCDGGNALDPDEAIALGAALVRAGLKARGGQ